MTSVLGGTIQEIAFKLAEANHADRQRREELDNESTLFVLGSHDVVYINANNCGITSQIVPIFIHRAKLQSSTSSSTETQPVDPVVQRLRSPIHLLGVRQRAAASLLERLVAVPAAPRLALCVMCGSLAVVSC